MMRVLYLERFDWHQNGCFTTEPPFACHKRDAIHVMFQNDADFGWEAMC